MRARAPPTSTTASFDINVSHLAYLSASSPKGTLYHHMFVWQIRESLTPTDSNRRRKKKKKSRRTEKKEQQELNEKESESMPQLSDIGFMVKGFFMRHSRVYGLRLRVEGFSVWGFYGLWDVKTCLCVRKRP